MLNSTDLHKINLRTFYLKIGQKLKNHEQKKDYG